MNDKEPLRHDLQAVVDEFSRIRDAYVALKTYCDIQEKMLTMEKLHSNRTKENLEKLSKTYGLLEKRYKSMIGEFKDEKERLQGTIEDLKEQCDHLRCITTDHNGDNGQVYRLESEIADLKTELLIQTAKHSEDVAMLKQKHSDELQRYKVLLQNAKLGGAASSGNKKKGRPKRPANEEENIKFFRWPELTIERISSAPVDAEDNITTVNNSNKKRRLFFEENDDAVSIVQTDH